MLMVLLGSGPGRASGQTPERVGVEYQVILDRPQTQTFRVVMRIADVSDPQVEVQMPTWRPGRYVILDPASEVRRLAATDADGRALDNTKLDKTTWLIRTGASEDDHRDILIEYEIYANELSLRTRHVDASHAFIDGSCAFMLYAPRRDRPAIVQVQAPPGWRVSTGLETRQPGVFIAPNYDILVDSPFEIGTHEVLAFQVDGVEHEIAIWGQAPWDPERLRRDFADIVREQAAVFGGLPYDRYVFQLHVQPGLSGGTEHYNSTIMQTRPSTFETPESYRGFLGLVAHEFFHTWNVKRFRPAGISRYDYSGENYTRLLWVAEGTTSYYDDLTLARVGLIKVGDYLKRLSDSIDGLRSRPGERVQSLEEASFDAWIKFYRPGPDRENTTVSFYSKGALASLVLDVEIRSRTNDSRSLDDVMRMLHERFPLGGPGYTPEDLIAIASEAAGDDLEDVFDSYISRTEPLPLEHALAYLGLELYEKPISEPWDKEDGREPATHRAYLGLHVKGGQAGARVGSVLEDGPAFEAGIIADDEILAINDRRVDSGSFGSVERRLSPGEPVTITLFRRDQLLTIPLIAGERRNARWTVKLAEDPSPEQIRAFEKWMDRPWPSNDRDHEDKNEEEG
ncbi:MAG: PDZ domain-containing protein [Phycisphaerales bacterium]